MADGRHSEQQELVKNFGQVFGLDTANPWPFATVVENAVDAVPTPSDKATSAPFVAEICSKPPAATAVPNASLIMIAPYCFEVAAAEPRPAVSDVAVLDPEYVLTK